ncbi:MAG TPA: DUF5642 family protein [Mycobacterium sp.]|nr:DUF5642 family protein [Mycobacterium sp.]
MTEEFSVVSTGVRLRQFTVLAVVAATACSPPERTPAPGQSSSAVQTTQLNPANIRRMRGSFPPGYEISEIGGVASPAKYWGLKPGWSAEPAQCGALADPTADGSSSQGLSGSGSGGIIYVAVAGASSASGPDPDVVAACSHWSMDSGRTTANVELVDAPAIENAATIGMVTASRTTVEGGTETDLHATTATAYLGDHVAFVTVVTDPGSGPSGLPPNFASTFLVLAVAALRG